MNWRLNLILWLAGAGGLFGWLFWRPGLEAAMAAHFGYDPTLFYGVVAVV